MQSIYHTIKRSGYATVAFAVAFAAVLPALLAPLDASAAQVTSRNIKMSTSAVSTAAQYEINFTTATTSTIQGVVVDFCSQSPIIGNSTCTLPTGMTVGATVASQTGLTAGTWTGSTAQAGGSKTLVITNGSGASVSSGQAVSITVTGFTNSSTVGTFYARIFTFSTTAGANAYTSGTPGTHVDDGGVALATEDAIGVTATVQESLTFCISAAAPGTGCTSTTAPSIVIGNGGSPSILDAAGVYTATIYHQLSTNAQGATTVRMKGSSALTSGSNTIGPSATSTTPFTITAGTANYGVRSSAGTGGTGTVTPQAPYNSGTQYGLDTTTSNDNVTATYGDVLATATGAILNVNSPVIFGATAGASTPAGIYTASYSLIATSSY
jgi:hypothetical protein